MKAPFGTAALEPENEERAGDGPDLVASIAGMSPSPLPRGSLVAECVDVRHPVLASRVLVTWLDARGLRIERWVPSLHGLVLRPGDRVLLDHPTNFAEPIVTGVIDGFSRRPSAPTTQAGAIVLQADETLRVTTPEGQPLLELTRSETGPVVRLLCADVEVQIEGALRVAAKSIDLRAREGEVRLTATADVNVEGENINLN